MVLIIFKSENCSYTGDPPTFLKKFRALITAIEWMEKVGRDEKGFQGRNSARLYWQLRGSLRDKPYNSEMFNQLDATVRPKYSASAQEDVSVTQTELRRKQNNKN